MARARNSPGCSKDDGYAPTLVGAVEELSTRSHEAHRGTTQRSNRRQQALGMEGSTVSSKKTDTPSPEIAEQIDLDDEHAMRFNFAN